MSYAIDLNARQSARTLEQAIRQQAHATLEPRVWAEGQNLLCRLEPHGSPLDLDTAAVVTVAALSHASAEAPSNGQPDAARPVTIEELRELIGTYVDASMHLGEQRYMFSSDVIRVLPGAAAGEPPCLHLSRPPVLQVAQRRRFRRTKLSHSAQVDLGWTHDGLRMGGVGWLLNISGDGMACRTEERVAESLWIGDELEMDFTLAPGDTERFHITGVLCNKTPTGNLAKVILGIHFITDGEHAESAQAAGLLRQRLVERATLLADTQKGLD